jgi:dienelactone hydrolase
MTSRIDFTSQGKSVPAELYSPPTNAKTGIVLVLYGTDGLMDGDNGAWGRIIRDYAESLAASGFAAMIPDYFSATGTLPGKSAHRSISQHVETWQRIVADSIRHCATLPFVDMSRVGLLGFSLGGHLALRLRGQAKVVVEYFAPQLEGIGESAALKHVQIHHGDNDKAVPFDRNAKRIKEILDGEETPTELMAYPGANHGFVGPEPANVNARNSSKAATLNCFATHL